MSGENEKNAWYEAVIDKVGPQQIVAISIVLLVAFLAILITLSYAISKNLCVDFNGPKLYRCEGYKKLSIEERIRKGDEFNVVFSIRDNREVDCRVAENQSPLGDFVVGGVYSAKYNNTNNRFFVEGLSQHVEGCPFHVASDESGGTNWERDEIVLWGWKFKFDESGRIFDEKGNGKHVGFISFPPD